MADQFSRLRDGDRFFYLNGDQYTGAFGDLLAFYAQNTTLSNVLLRNTGITSIQSNAFLTAEA